ncbi:hypothetical protein FKV24_014145 [Lysobacter maris]|uniref:Uncharacterized protein n=1 Tax=Marilutibacter maris TaxID=1605891 RepID=A0A508AJR0_9GAMM|nr:hypothetical protein [Lysobacter maris]KAB8173380.1 hypothetical protein FKV24_014145 [Lysobacter maris]
MSKQRAKHVRLLPLVEACADIEGLLDAGPQGVPALLLSLCLEKSICAYFCVPEGLVAVSYKFVKRDCGRMSFGPGKGEVAYKHGPMADRNIKYLGLDEAHLQGLRDAGFVTIEGFQNDGLTVVKGGLLRVGVEYGVIRKDVVPHSHGAFFGMYSLREWEVNPIPVSLRVTDVLIAVQDVTTLRALIGERHVHDKWGHREAAPSVFLAYRMSQDPYDFKGVMKALIDEDPEGFFNRAIATTMARIMKMDVRPNAEKGIAVEKIANNGMGKDYSDPNLSKRMSLLLLATDCWIHDEALRAVTETRLAPAREEAAKQRELLSQKQRDELDQRVFHAEQLERSALQARLKMPSGLRDYLRSLGFRANQADHLYHVITRTQTGRRHVQTEKEAAAARVLTKARRLRNLGDNR